MKAGEAKRLARQWVETEGIRVPGFAGGFLHGSINWLPDDAELPETSDVDTMLVLDDQSAAVKPGKFWYRGVLLEVSFIGWDQLRLAEDVLSQSDIAASFRVPSVIADPSGRLDELQAAVAENFAKRTWVHARCEHARDKVIRNLDSLSRDQPFHEQVTSWLFGTGVTTHILLTAGFRNPTVRKRYVAAKELLAEYGREDAYEPLLDLLGGMQMSREQARSHLTALTEAFDTAKLVIKTRFFFAADISDLARPVAIDGSLELIESGFHREAVFWIVATYARCQAVFHHDAPVDQRDRFAPGFQRLVSDLGIDSFDDLRYRADQVLQSLPWIWDLAETTMAANPDIKD